MQDDNKQNNKLICIPPSVMGIGNRLKYLVSFLRYYNDPDEITLVWNNEGWVNKKFFDLFNFNIDTKINETNDYRLPCSPSPASWRLWVNDTDKKPDVLNNDPFDKHMYRIDLLYNKTPKYYINIYKKYFSKLNPSLKVAKIMKEINVTDDMVAVQIRDNKDWKEWGRTLYADLFIEQMLKYPKNTKFFLSAMNKKISKKITNIFKDQIIEIPNKKYRSSLHAAADMFLLSIPNRALCSCGSTFYEISWWLSEKQPKVQVIGDYKNWTYV